MVLLTKAESAFGPRGATITRKPEYLTKLLGARSERSTAVTDECKGYPKNQMTVALLAVSQLTHQRHIVPTRKLGCRTSNENDGLQTALGA